MRSGVKLWETGIGWGLINMVGVPGITLKRGLQVGKTSPPLGPVNLIDTWPAPSGDLHTMSNSLDLHIYFCFPKQ